MRPSSVNLPEVAVAFSVIAFGIFVLWEGSSYAFGSVTRMGPGFFPVVLGIALIAIGSLLAVEVASAQTSPPRIAFRPFVMVTAGILSFAVLAERAGLVPAATALVVLSALGERQLRPVTMGVLAVALSLVGMLLFVKGFSLPFRAVRW